MSRPTTWRILPVLLAVLGAPADAGNGSVAVSGGRIVLKSEQPYMRGSYAAFAGPWSRWLDHSITDFTNRISIDAAQWPRNVGMSWEFPQKYASTGVYGYNYLAFGQYWDLKPPQPVAPKKFSDIRSLSFAADFRLLAGSADSNVLAEFFVTREPGNIDSRTAEIGWLLNMPQRTKDYFRNGRQIGVYKDARGREWQVASHNDGAAGHYILFAPKAGAPPFRAPIDALASVRWLAARGEIGLDTYFNGMAVGVEPLKGAGSIAIRRFDVTFE